jgi:hypothetical protein
MLETSSFCALIGRRVEHSIISENPIANMLGRILVPLPHAGDNQFDSPNLILNAATLPESHPTTQRSTTQK